MNSRSKDKMRSQTDHGNNRVTAFGEIMMRLNCQYGRRFTDPGSMDILFGGAEANVCVFLSGLGMPTRLVTRLPDNDLGMAALDRLKSQGIDISFISTGEGRMGLYFTENGYTLRPSRVIYDRKNSSFSRIGKGMIDWEQALNESGWFHWSGITPAISAGAAEICLEGIQTAKKLGLSISVDLNYRSNLWDYGKHPAEVMPELLSYCDVLIGDLHSASLYFNLELRKEEAPTDQFRSCAVELKSRFDCLKTIAFSFRNQDDQQRDIYRGILYAENEFHFSPAHAIPQVIDRIGSGDAFGAGLIFSLSKAFLPQQAIDFSTACGILKHSVYGDFARISEKEVNLFMHQGPGHRVIR
jgi:2-dehydro-3-deoxygluconokinase